MKIQNLFLNVTLCLMLLSMTSPKTLTESMENYCNDDTVREITLNQEDFENLREWRDNQFYGNYKDIIEWGKDPKESNKLLNSFLAAAVLMIIFLVVILLSMIAYFLLMCGFFQNGESKKLNFYGGTIAFGLFTILFIVFIVFLGMTQFQYKRAMCSIFKIPAAAIDGYKDKNGQFIGL